MFNDNFVNVTYDEINILFYSILLYSILFYSIPFDSILGIFLSFIEYL